MIEFDDSDQLNDGKLEPFSFQEQKIYDYGTVLNLIDKVAKNPLVKVDREQFLRQQFADSPYLEQILLHGPQSVYKTKELKKKARKIVRSNATKASFISFAARLSTTSFAASIPLKMVDFAQYLAFAIQIVQRIAYLFGKGELFCNGGDLTEEVKTRVNFIICVSALISAASANKIAQFSTVLGANVGKKVAGQALTKTTWYPLMKEIGALLGQKITKKTVEKTISNVVPLIGDVVSGGFTFEIFRFMGFLLTNEFVGLVTGKEEKMELNPEFLASIVDVDSSDHC